MLRQRIIISTTAVALLATACGSDGDGKDDARSSPSGSTVTSVPAAGRTISEPVDIGGGRSLFVDCTGTKGPTIVFESGLATSHTAFDPVHKLLAPDQRTCTYDRAGVALSSAPQAATRTSADVVADLHALMTAIGEKAPYVLVGWSIGGLFVQHFAAMHPNEVAGLVLVESVAPDEQVTFAKHLTPQQIADDRAQVIGNIEKIDPFASMEEVRAAGPLPDVPVVVITAARSDGWPDGWDAAVFDRLRMQLQKALATGPHRSQLIATNSGHDVLQEQPEIVAKAIATVLAG
jgi:pimeloyl-ACP methyl ester carboxylesterase